MAYFAVSEAGLCCQSTTTTTPGPVLRILLCLCWTHEPLQADVSLAFFQSRASPCALSFCLISYSPPVLV